MLCAWWQSRGADLQQTWSGMGPQFHGGHRGLTISTSPCTLSFPTAYFFCIPSRLEALATFRAELPSARGTGLRPVVQDPVCAPCRVSCGAGSAAPSASTDVPAQGVSWALGPLHRRPVAE